ncbi:MAG TPA: RsmE family RNA methyltransferase [Planctomycetota bacterium]
MAERTHSPARSRAFFLAPEASPAAPHLADEDVEHALRVLRLAAGDRLEGLDGRGGSLPLRVRSVARGRLDLEAAGPLQRTPEPGQEGSVLPWFELAVAWPRRSRVEDMLARLVQLGAAAIRPLAARQRGPEELPEGVSERLQRVAREACKQSRRRWLPVFEPSLAPAELAAARPISPIAVLDPRAGLSLDTWLRSLSPAPLATGTRARPIVLVIGPEGGLTEEELEPLETRGASRTWIGPHVLRVETAAEAAMAVAACVHGRPLSGREEAALAQGDELSRAHDHVVEERDPEHGPGLA